ncbi:hypothetical protein SC1_03262 [Sphingopyxis sp. C-1]|nr:hypothetical protein SC1_03262 [Sphingopyxis sp. C-1]
MGNSFRIQRPCDGPLGLRVNEGSGPLQLRCLIPDPEGKRGHR